MKNNVENGRSMLEMLGVLAVIGVITISGFGMVNKMNDQRKANQIMDYAGDLANKARVLVRDYERTDDPDDFTAYLKEGRAFPSDLTYSDKKFSGKADESYVLYAPKIADDVSVLYVLGIMNLSETVCIELATKNWGSPATNGFVGLSITGSYEDVNKYINDGTSKNYLSIVSDKNHPAPMLSSTAANYCSDGVNMFLSFK